MNRSQQRVLVTGGAGFIGSHLVKALVARGDLVANIDKLGYAGRRRNLDSLLGNQQHRLIVLDIREGEAVRQILSDFQPDVVVHLAAESHVDRSIARPSYFAENNVVGTARLLEAVHHYWSNHGSQRFRRFVHISTDEVFGELSDNDAPFHPDSPYAPNSPYSASKAACDHFVRAFAQTYQLPVVIAHCANNYGPFQHPEKFIPNSIRCGLMERPIPLYGTGNNIRDWIYVEDNVAAILRLVDADSLQHNRYLIGARNPLPNRIVLKLIVQVLDRYRPRSSGASYAELVQHVTDRAGHDWRYEVDPLRFETELQWKPAFSFSRSLVETVLWYCRNEDWVVSVLAEIDDAKG